MAYDIAPREKASTVEVLGVMFVTATTVRDLSQALEGLRIVPRWLQKPLLHLCGGDKNTMYLWVAVVFLAFISWLLILKSTRVAVGLNQNSDSAQPKVSIPHKPKTDKKLKDTIEDFFKRERRKRAIKTIGFTLFREYILDKMLVLSYGTFLRPKEWGPPLQALHDRVDRIQFKDGRGIEFQYYADKKKLHVREHPADDMTYGKVRQVEPKEYRCLLMFASSYFPIWYLRKPLFLTIATGLVFWLLFKKIGG